MSEWCTATYLIQSALTSARSNAVERGFSINNALLTNGRVCLDEMSIVAEHVVKDAVMSFEGSSQFAATKCLIHCTRLGDVCFSVYGLALLCFLCSFLRMAEMLKPLINTSGSSDGSTNQDSKEYFPNVGKWILLLLI